MTNEEKSIDASNPSKSVFWKYITAAAVVIGILGSLAEVLNFINIFPTKQSAELLQLTVFVTDTEGNVVLEHEGILNTSLGNRPMRETIGEHGRTNFDDVHPDNLGDTISIGFKAEGWEIADGLSTFVFDGKPIILKVKKDNSLGIINGIVKTRDGQDFIQGAQVMINTDTTIFTDANGIFRVKLPAHMCVKKVLDSYKLTISKKGFKTKSEYYYPKSNSAEIRLDKTE